MEIVGNEVYEAENPKAIREARDFSHVRFTNLPKISQDIRFKLLINSLGFDRSDLYKPTLIDLEFIYNGH